MTRHPNRFSFLKWRLEPLQATVLRHPEDSLLEKHLGKARFSVRLLRYWWAARAIREEAWRSNRPLQILDYGAGRGWLRRFVGNEVDAHWIAVDWQPDRKSLQASGYDEIHECNFDRALPLVGDTVDIVVALHVFEHLPRPAFSLTEVERVLAPGGSFLAATPTMPGPLARWRQAGFRRGLQNGRIARGGHINCFSPGRWRDLLGDCGLATDLVTGSHLVRHTGNPLENSRLWIRLNQAWGALFPSLGSEVCLRARKPADLPEEVARWKPEVLTGSRRRPRLAIAGGGLAAAIGILSIFLVTEEALDAHVERLISQQAELDAGHFLVVDHPSLDGLISRDDVTVVGDVGEIGIRLSQMPPGTHLVLHEDQFESFSVDPGQYVIDSRIDAGGHDFYLIRPGNDGTCLVHFLSTAEE